MGPTPLTFISGISPIGQGTLEKRAGNSNIVFFIVYKNDCFGQDNDFVWLPGAAPRVLVLPGGHWVVPGGPWMLPGGCLVVTGHKMKVSESLGKGVFCPLASLGVVFMGSSFCYSE